jgi:hypothetical protein
MSGSRRLKVPGPARLLAAAVAVLALTAAGCSSGHDQPSSKAAAPPAGFATYRGPTYTIAYPTGWQPSQQPNPGGGPATVVITGPPGAGGFTPQIAVGHDTNYASDFDDALAVFRTVSIGKTGRVVSDQPTRLAGAAKAQRTEYTETHQGTDGRSYTVRLVELHAITPNRTMFDVLVRAPDQDFAGAQLGQALDSFRIAP